MRETDLIRETERRRETERGVGGISLIVFRLFVGPEGTR